MIAILVAKRVLSTSVVSIFFGVIGAHADCAFAPIDGQLIAMVGQQSSNGGARAPLGLEIKQGTPTQVTTLDLRGEQQLMLKYKGHLATEGHNFATGRDINYSYEPISGSPWSLEVGSTSTYRRILAANGTTFADDLMTQKIIGEGERTIGGCSLKTVAIGMEAKSNLNGNVVYVETLYSPAIGYSLEMHSTWTKDGVLQKHDFMVTELRTK